MGLRQPFNKILNTTMTGAIKTTTLGDFEVTIMDPRKAFQRPSILTPNWTRARIGAYISLVGLASDNAVCVAESQIWVNNLDDFSVGISNGVGGVGQAGNRFIGLGRTAGAALSNTYVSGMWRGFALTTSSAVPTIGDGATRTVNTSAAIGPIYGYFVPEGTANFCAFIGIDITLSPTAALVRQLNLGSGAGATDTSELAMRSALASSWPVGGSVVGGWWNGAAVGCTHVYLRTPYLSNRLRVHAIEVEQLA